MKSRFRERLLDRGPHPLLVAHRGDSFRAPENTLEAASRGFEAGAEAWELDVQLTRDGVAVVLHDESLIRTTDVANRFPDDPRRLDGYRVSDFEWSEVEGLDAGSWFLGPPSVARTAADFGTLALLQPADRQLYDSGRVRVPTLERALLLTRELDWLVNVELKAMPEAPPGLLDVVLDTIASTGTADRVLLSSFDHRQIAGITGPDSAWKATREAIPRGILVDTPLHRPYRYLTRSVMADTYHVSYEALGGGSIAYRRDGSRGSLWGADLVELIEHQIPILVYTVNDDRLARDLAAIGANGLFTDDPGGLRAAFGSGPR
ncbi:MAG: glycerophosphodiester phosphodiesterase family protein [Isosphaeraceae bacterium]